MELEPLCSKRPGPLSAAGCGSGIPRQIAAARFLARVQEHYKHLRSCRRCLNWETCPRMTADFDVEDAAWALVAGGGQPLQNLQQLSAPLGLPVHARPQTGYLFKDGVRPVHNRHRKEAGGEAGGKELRRRRGRLFGITGAVSFGSAGARPARSTGARSASACSLRPMSLHHSGTVGSVSSLGIWLLLNWGL